MGKIRISLLLEGDSTLKEGGIEEIVAIEDLLQLEQDLVHALPDTNLSIELHKGYATLTATYKVPKGQLTNRGLDAVRYDIEIRQPHRTVILTIDPTYIELDDYNQQELRSLKDELLKVRGINSRVDDVLRQYTTTNGLWYESPFNRREVSDKQLRLFE